MIDYVNTDLILLDLHLQMPKDGLDITKIIDERGGPSYIFITANADILIVQEAIQTKAVGYISKPIKKADLMEWTELQLAKSQFIRIHRSIIINLLTVEKMSGKSVFINQTKITISRTHSAKISEYIKNEH